ncbi:MAG: indole-3-glycerol phosphate synthase [Gammaproteobacteria bacterium]|nr:indole-3-glycerol-phosphate synthase [Gammaproteobacteria bacterium]
MSGVAGNFLERMAAASQRRCEQARARIDEAALRRHVSALPAPPAPRFDAAAFHLIAEVKRRSPSAGQLAAASLSPVDQAGLYARAGALVVSVLTEPEEFAGDLADLEAVTTALPALPVMRKDFLVSPYQVLEARAAGAAGVLLIAAMLEPRKLEAMLACALELGLFVLVEVFGADDLARCQPAVLAAAATPAGQGRVLLGVNCRDLRTLRVDTGRFATLAPLLPVALPWVAESGIETPAQAGEVAALGYRLALVGTALMRSGDVVTSAAALLAAGRAALRSPAARAR